MMFRSPAAKQLNECKLLLIYSKIIEVQYVSIEMLKCSKYYKFIF